MIVPVTRKEKLLNAIATNGNVDFSPKTREELFLFKILGADVNAPTPITRKEILYQHIIDGTIPTFEPRTRLEKFIMVAAGAELELPVVLTREEYWWAEISDSAYETITGAIVHFIAKRARAIKSLIANISYTQDLHGYDSPWPAGGGVNLLDPAKCSVVGPSGAYGLTVTHDQATAIWTISGTPTLQNAAMGFNFCIYSDFSLSGKGYQVQAFPISGTPIRNLYGFRNEAENRIAIIIDTVANPTVNMTFKVSVAATAQTAWSPYSNICPISGWSEVTVEQRGKNLFDESTIYHGYYAPDIIDRMVLDEAYRTCVLTLPAGTYTFSCDMANIYILRYAIGEQNTSVTKEQSTVTFTVPSEAVVKICFRNTGTTAITGTFHTQIESGSTATAYESYTGTTYPISWQSTAGTVYGGTLDVTTGVLTVNKVALTFNGSEGWTSVTANGHTRQRVNSVLIGIKQITGGWQTPNLISDRYSTKTPNATYAGTVGITNQQNSEDLYIMDNRYDYVDSASDYKTWLSTNNLKVAYELAEPVTYQLTPTEVTTLVGDNTIWADTGDVTVTYNGL